MGRLLLSIQWTRQAVPFCHDCYKKNKHLGRRNRDSFARWSLNPILPRPMSPYDMCTKNIQAK